MKSTTALFLTGATVVTAGMAALVVKLNKNAVQSSEAPTATAQIEVGPFDIHRKYRSMEGPYVAQTLKVGDMIASRRIEIPESMVTFVEGDSQTPSMNASQNGSQSGSSAAIQPRNLVRTNNDKALYWVKGIKLQVLDENDRPLPTAEFICHLNVDVDPRKQIFDSAEGVNTTRLFTLTQGQTEFHFPEGYAVPVSSNEKWKFTFQAANRTTSEHRRVKHLCSIDFVKDSDLKTPMKALSWYSPYIAVVMDKATREAQTKGEMKHHGPSCLMVSSGASAPNMVAGSSIKDSQGRTLNGHWAVPPGVHTYTSPVTNERDAGFADKDRVIHAVWTHIHPLCREASLVECDGEKTTPVFTVTAQTSTTGGLQITHIDDICSKGGILLKGGKHYEMKATYDNVTAQTQDSMVVDGIFFEDEKFIKPSWAAGTHGNAAVAAVPQEVPTSGDAGNGRPAESRGGDGTGAGARTGAGNHGKPARSVGTTSASGIANEYNGTDRYPLFDSSKDGDLLKNKKPLELRTSAGKLHLVLDPAMAPEHATQLYKLFKAKAFDDTPIFRYQPGFILQVSSAELKNNPDRKLPNQTLKQLRRLPLEVASQVPNGPAHKKWVLTMARSGAADSA
ncbi:MAG TPA: peptidylprolyl isomerase, partial [Chroococcales cyanobacterium]